MRVQLHAVSQGEKGAHVQCVQPLAAHSSEASGARASPPHSRDVERAALTRQGDAAQVIKAAGDRL